ncbi:unnamed protein product [Orchesella dallaii]|uniref:Glycylpeptide N-tetradecanoyltransferase n=1 Tax=Orchesella dallaii TaxID=48710 RepID=A0ABP1QPA9_9HEXA
MMDSGGKSEKVSYPKEGEEEVENVEGKVSQAVSDVDPLKVLEANIQAAASKLRPTLLVDYTEPEPGPSHVQTGGAPGSESGELGAPGAGSLWAHQAVMQPGEVSDSNEPIAHDELSFLGTEAGELPAGLMWCYDMGSGAAISRTMVEEIHLLLRDNYVQDSSSTFQLEYTANQINWVLGQGEDNAVVVGIKSSGTDPDDLIGEGQLVGFVAAVPAKISIHGQTIKVGLVNFLCVHRLLRDRRLTPLLLAEIMRRLNARGIRHASFTTSSILPLQAVADSQYFHFPINVMTLGSLGFIEDDPLAMPINKVIDRWESHERNDMFHPLTTPHISSALTLVSDYLQKFAIKQVFDVETFTKMFGNKSGVVRTYVREKDGVVTDLISYYVVYLKKLGTTKSQIHNEIQCAHALVNVATSMSLIDLMKVAIVHAKDDGCDVYNLLNIMDNQGIVRDMDFVEGTGTLAYFLYNWRCPKMRPDQVGLVLP